MKATEQGPGAFYWFTRRIFSAYFRLRFPLKVTGADWIPSTGGVLIASNHASYLDPPLLGVAIPNRVVRFMARDTLFEHPFMNWFMNKVGVTPLDRNRGDIAALKTAINLMKGGHCVGLFPEGTRTIDGQLQEAKGGIGFLIHKASVPVVPVFIQGTFDVFPKGAKKMRRHPVHIFIGKPIPPSELILQGENGKPDYDAIGKLVMTRIADLKPTLQPPQPVA